MTASTPPSGSGKNLIQRLDIDFALQTAGLGVWEFDPLANRVTWDERCRQLFGLETNLTYEQASAFIHPEDRERIDQAFTRAMNPASDGIYNEIFRTTKATNRQALWVRVAGKSQFNEAGEVTCLTGIAMDVTESKRLETSEARFRNLVDQAPVAVAIFRGPKYIIELANDAHLQLWGHRADEVLNKPLFEALPEASGHGYEEILDHILATGEPFYANELSAPLVRHGRLETVYFNFTYQALREADGTITGVMVVANDITEQVLANRNAEESEKRFRSLIEESPVATALLTGRELRIEVANETIIRHWGKTPAVIGQTLQEALPELEGQPFLSILDNVFTTGRTYEAQETQAMLVVNGVLSPVYFDFIYTPLRNSTGAVYAIMVTAADVTQRVLNRRAVEESETFARNVVYNSFVSQIVWEGEAMTIRMVNEQMLDMLGRDASIVGQPFMEAMPELTVTPLMDRLRQVYTTGETYTQPGEKINLIRFGQPYTGYYNYTYQALRTIEGTIYGVICTAVEVTDLVVTRQQIEESEARIRSLVESAPFPIGVYTGREMRIQLANQSILDVWGKGNDVIGKLYAEILPELENQAIFDQLDGVYTTGVPFHAKNQRVDIVVDSKLSPYYFNYSFTPLFDATGKVYGVMNTAAEITDLVLAKQQVDESEATLRGAIELAELGTWSYDPATGISEFSDRLRNWFGLTAGEIITPESGYLPIRPADRPRVAQATQHATTPGTDGLYEVEFTVEAAQAGKERIIHSVGKIQLDEREQPYKLVGTAQDVTRQRNLQLALEQQVKERTEELEAANEELATTNEELAANNEEYAAINEELLAANQDTDRINEELMESTSLLMRSNENLQRFAYVASHDLQEPLRKIQQFGDLLKGRFADRLGEGVDYLERMQVAANRMSTLIRDLLDFSRIATQRDSNEAVSLTDVVNGVVADLELTIQETGAVVSVDPLPNLFGDASQLKQLFQNLLSNALKFRRTDPSGVPVVPRIQVRSERVAADALPFGVRPDRQALVYHRIDVIDNGIGFDEKYLDRIFQVFQRLHGRQEYAGTGIGLAICEKVVTNHGGAITASSQPGQGATFSVFLPDTPG